jgi:hypothetical protein
MPAPPRDQLSFGEPAAEELAEGPLMTVRNALVAIALTVAGISAGAARADVTFADFENNSTSGFGSFTWASGVGAFGPGVSGSVITPSTSTLTTKVLDLSTSGFNGGLDNSTYAANLGYNFVAQGRRDDFLANDTIAFDFTIPTGASSGYSQIFKVFLNGQGAPDTTLAQYDGGTNTPANMNQYSFAGYTGSTHHLEYNYSAFKSALAANPGWIQLGIVTNNGGGAPNDFYFDNFKLITTPEPGSLTVLAGAAAIGALGRRRRAA